MAGRLISPPEGLPLVSMEPLSGPRSVGAAGTQSVNGFVQTSGAAFGMWRWRIDFGPMRGDVFRRYRGWITALHGGANATRWKFDDPDMMQPEAIGVAAPQGWGLYYEGWSNGLPWSSGMGWGLTPPVVAISEAAGRDTSIVSLSQTSWGHELGYGDLIGVFPFHFGMYMVTEVIEPGRYRVWPPLRKELALGDFATLVPHMAMRLESEDAAAAARGAVTSEGASVTLIEVLDSDVRDYFAE